MRRQLLLQLCDRIHFHDAAFAQQPGCKQRRNQHRLDALHEDHVVAVALTNEMQQEQREEQQRRRYRTPTIALEQTGGREPRDANAIDDFAGAGRSKVVARRDAHGRAVRTHAPRQ